MLSKQKLEDYLAKKSARAQLMENRDRLEHEIAKLAQELELIEVNPSNWGVGNNVQERFLTVGIQIIHVRYYRSTGAAEGGRSEVRVLTPEQVRE